MTHKQSGFTHVFNATELDAREALCSIVPSLRDLGVAEEQVGGVEIALSEAVNNIVEHAYHGLEPGEIRVLAEFEAERLRLRISDHGHPLPDGKLPEGKPADISGPVSDLPEGGFGWFMIRTLARDICYVRQNGQNHLHLVFDLIPPAV